jgi:hypothetical protein
MSNDRIRRAPAIDVHMINLASSLAIAARKMNTTSIDISTAIRPGPPAPGWHRVVSQRHDLLNRGFLVSHRFLMIPHPGDVVVHNQTGPQCRVAAAENWHDMLKLLPVNLPF